MNKNTLIIATILLSISCINKEKTKNTLTPVKDVVFDVGFNTSPKFVNYFFDNNKQYVYFADPVSRRIMKIFDIEGNFIDSVPLNNVVNEILFVENISFKSLDTIFAFSDYQNKNNIVVFNRKGEIFKKVNLDSLISKITDNKYEVYNTSNYTEFMKNNILMLNACWIGNKNDKQLNKVPTTSLEFLQYAHTNIYHSNYFLKINDFFSETPQIKFGFSEYGKAISEIPSLIIGGGSRFSYINNSIFVLTRYNNFIFEVDKKTLNLKRKIKIESNYSKLNRKPLELDSNLIENMNNSLLLDKTMGRISSIHYNNYLKKYFVVVSHDKPVEKAETWPSGFSIITYDLDFNKIKEFPFTELKYVFRPILTDKGILLLNYQEYEKDKKRRVYTLFKFG